MSRRRWPPEQISRALAYAFLAAPEWRHPSLHAAGRLTVGRWYSWLRPTVGAVLDHYPDRPTDRPLELARLIASIPALQEGWAKQQEAGQPVHVGRLTVEPSRSVERHWPIPPADDLTMLATLLQVPVVHLPWLADTRALQRRTADGPYQLYRYCWVERPGRLPRLLEAPTPLLRQVLRRLLHDVLDWVPSHDAAHGFVPGRSALSHARRHVGTDVVISLDLRHFFTAVTRARTYGVFRMLGYPEPVAHTLAALVTNQTPRWVLRELPPGGDPSARHRLRSWLRESHLAQGAPTSPALANLTCHTLDARLTGYAGVLGATYSRYADDLAFSGPAALRAQAPRLIRAVTGIVAEEGFAVNTAKTRVQPATQRQLVTGIVVNQTSGVVRRNDDRLRAILHDAAIRGPAVANREEHPDFRAHLTGRVGWVESVNPVRGARLRAQLERIAWPEA